jgi:hypothetical protein
MTPEELMFLMTPQRRINPTTGSAIPKRGPKGFEADFSVPGQIDPYAALMKRAGEIASRGASSVGEAVALPFTPNTWYGKQVINPNGTFGPKIYEYNPLQKIGAGAAGTGALIGTGVALDDAMHPKNVATPVTTPSNATPTVDEGHLDPNLFGVQYPKAGMDRGNAFGVNELSAYPAGAVHNYNRSNAPSVDEISAYPRSPVQMAKQRMAAIQSTGDAAGLPPARPTSGGLANLFSGKDYQSKGGELRQDGKINWGDPESAADFFRASRAQMDSPDAAGINPGMKRGGAANGKPDKDAALHKALDIIAHMLGRH